MHSTDAPIGMHSGDVSIGNASHRCNDQARYSFNQCIDPDTGIHEHSFSTFYFNKEQTKGRHPAWTKTYETQKIQTRKDDRFTCTECCPRQPLAWQPASNSTCSGRPGSRTPRSGRPKPSGSRACRQGQTAGASWAQRRLDRPIRHFQRIARRGPTAAIRGSRSAIGADRCSEQASAK
jgi:hypothetical protein